MEKGYDWLIVGAGLFGSVFAHEMAGDGLRCLVIDRRGKAGGNCSCRYEHGIHLHEYGAHIVHTDRKEIWDYIDRLVPLRGYHHQVMACNGGRVYTLPFCLHTFKEIYGTATPEEARAAILKDCEERGEVESVEDLALTTSGRRIFRTLIEGYTMKQWGKPCGELPAFILGRVPLRYTYDTSYYDAEYVGLPEDGDYNTLFRRLLEGCDVRLNTPFEPSMLGLADRVLYTGGIDAYFGYRLGRLEYRSLDFEWREGDASQGCAVMNYTGTEVPFTRVIEHNFFNTRAGGKIVHSFEYPTAYDGRNEPVYPINTGANNALYTEYAELARRERGKVIFGGRLGSYRYYAMDACIEAALKLADGERRAGLAAGRSRRQIPRQPRETRPDRT